MTQSSHTFDPGQEQIGTVYAKALVAAAEKSGQSDQVVEELEEIVSEVFDKLPQVAAALTSPRLKHEEKLLMLDKAFGGKVSTTTLNFLKVLSRHGRMGSIRATARSARKLLNESRNRVEVEVRTAAPLSNPLREAISTKLAAMLGREVVLNTTVDPELLGGVVVRVGDTLYDGSLSSKLLTMRSQAIERTAARFRDSLNKFVTT
jgi:F-type H+-transporting ATPase subunit delta